MEEQTTETTLPHYEATYFGDLNWDYNDLQNKMRHLNVLALYLLLPQKHYGHWNF